MSKYIDIIDVRYNDGEEIETLQKIKRTEAYIDRHLNTPIINDEWRNFVKTEGKTERTVKYLTSETEDELVDKFFFGDKDTNVYDVNNNLLTRTTQAVNPTAKVDSDDSARTLARDVEEIRVEKKTKADFVFTANQNFDSQLPDSAGNERLYYRYPGNIVNYSIEVRQPFFTFPTPPSYTWAVTHSVDHSVSRLNVACTIAPDTYSRPAVKVTSLRSYLVNQNETEINCSFEFWNLLAVNKPDFNEKYLVGSVLIFTLEDGSLVESSEVLDIDYTDIPGSLTFGRLNSTFSPKFIHTIPVGAVSFSHSIYIETYNIADNKNSFNFFFSNIRLFYKNYDWQKLKAIALEGFYDNLNPSLTISKALNDNNLILGESTILRTFVL